MTTNCARTIPKNSMSRFRGRLGTPALVDGVTVVMIVTVLGVPDCVIVLGVFGKIGTSEVGVYV